MIRTVMLKLQTDKKQRDTLLATMEAYSFAFNASARWGFNNRTCNRIRNHHGTYHPIRLEIPSLNSGLVQTARDDACRALKMVASKKLPSRKIHAAIRYNKNTSRVNLKHGFVSLSTITGRIKFKFNYSKYVNKFLDWRVIGSVLIYNKDMNDFFIGISVEKFNPVCKSDGPVLGIDRGLRNLAVTSDNRFFNSSRLNGIRGRYAYNRKVLQAKGTHSALRKLKKLAGRERRFIACENHKLSKAIVQNEYEIFALEDLRGIGHQRKMSTNMRTRLNQWPLNQFSEFLAYKAEEMGKIVLFVDPRNTSRKCSKCGYESKDNRNGAEFKCLVCGFELNADLNAARNIADAGRSCISRLPVNQPIAPCDEGRTLKWDSGVTEHRCKHLRSRYS